MARLNPGSAAPRLCRTEAPGVSNICCRVPHTFVFSQNRETSLAYAISRQPRMTSSKNKRRKSPSVHELRVQMWAYPGTASLAPCRKLRCDDPPPRDVCFRAPAKSGVRGDIATRAERGWHRTHHQQKRGGRRGQVTSVVLGKLVREVERSEA